MGLADWTSKYETKHKVQLTNSQKLVIPRISTGSVILDYLTGGGWGVGLINEVCGPYSGGKTTGGLTTAARVQKNGGAVAWIAVEPLDEQYANSLEVDTLNKDLWIRVDLKEQDEVEEFIRGSLHAYKENNIKLIVVDSTTAICPKGADGVEVTEDNRPALVARFWSDFAKILSSLAIKAGITLLFISQVRDNINMAGGPPTKFLAPEKKEKVTGGNAMRHYKMMSLRLESSTIDKIKGSVDPLTGQKFSIQVGNLVSCRTIKNKLTSLINFENKSPFKQGKAYIRYGKGWDNLKDSLGIFIHNGFVKQSASGNYAFKTAKGVEVKVRGEKQLYTALQDYPKLCDGWLKKLNFTYKYF